MKASIVYYTATGNTEKMALFIKEVLEKKDYDTEISFVTEADLEKVLKSDLILLGSPAMGMESIEEYEFRPFFDALIPHLNNRSIVLFGSYDWGEGAWLESWEAEAISQGALVLASFKANLEPSESDCEEIEVGLNNVL